MKKVLGIFLICAIIFPLISAADIGINSEYKTGETIIVPIEGNFITALTKNNIYFYRGNVQTSFDYSLGRIGDRYYVYAQTEKNPNDYSIQIKNARYVENGRVVEETIMKEFRITAERAGFSVNPGIIISNDDFYLDIKNFNSEKISVNLASITTYGNSQGEFEFAASGQSPETSFEVMPGSRRRINILTGELGGTTIRNIRISSENFGYEVPAYVIVQNLPPEEDPQEPTDPNPNPEPECRNDEDCTGSDICQNLECVPPPEERECLTDDQCTKYDELCENYECVKFEPTPDPETPDEDECITNWNCNSGELCRNRKCVQDPNYGVKCNDDSGCFGTKVCRSNVCVELPDSGSGSSSSGSIGSAGGGSTQIPLGCLSDTGCKGDRVCKNGECVYPGSSAETSDPTDSVLKGCLSDESCKGERVCDNGNCVYPEQVLEEEEGCQDDSRCKGERIYVGGQCVYNASRAYNEIECVWDENCFPDERCINNECVLNDAGEEDPDQEDPDNGEEDEEKDYEIIVEEDGQLFAIKDGEIQKEPATLKTCAEIEGDVCQKSQICGGDEVYTQDAYCCVGGCVKEPVSEKTRNVGIVLIAFVVLLFLIFLSKYSKTKTRKFSISDVVKKI